MLTHSARVLLLCCCSFARAGSPGNPSNSAEALRSYINAQRSVCRLPLYAGPGIVTRAVPILENAIDLEARMGAKVYRATLTAGEVVPHTVLPPPCEENSYLAVTYEQIDAVNARNLPWKSAMAPEMINRVVHTEPLHMRRVSSHWLAHAPAVDHRRDLVADTGCRADCRAGIH